MLQGRPLVFIEFLSYFDPNARWRWPVELFSTNAPLGYLSSIKLGSWRFPVTDCKLECLKTRSAPCWVAARG